MTPPENLPGYPRAFVRFLGTAGARFTVLHQMRASGGLWIRAGGASWAIDPGPGALVRICEAHPPLDPESLDALVLTHRHIDHSTDLNVLAEALTGGGRRKHGVVVLSEDALSGPEPVFFRHVRDKVAQVVVWKAGTPVLLPGGTELTPVPLEHHGVDCFGFVARHPDLPTWGVVSDTRPLPRLGSQFSACELLIVHTTLRHSMEAIDHLSLDDARTVAEDASPRLVLLTHLGRGILQEGPSRLAESLHLEHTRFLAAWDGMVVNLETLVPEESFPEEPWERHHQRSFQREPFAGNSGLLCETKEETCCPESP